MYQIHHRSGVHFLKLMLARETIEVYLNTKELQSTARQAAGRLGSGSLEPDLPQVDGIDAQFKYWDLVAFPI